MLPAYGTDVRVGDLRRQFESAFTDAGPRTLSGRLWTFTPALDISETMDSSVLLPGAHGRDYITRITPSFVAEVAAQRLNGTLNYAPAFSLYALHGRETGVAHNLNMQLTATLVPELLFFDLRGYASTQPLLGGGQYGNTGASTGRVNDVQTASFSAGPSIQKRLSDLATLSAGYTVSRTSSSSLAPRGTTLAVPGVNSSYTSQQENASIALGPDFGRVNGSLSMTAMQFEGGGLYQGAHNETVTAKTGFAITRAITLTGSLGHETIVYGPGGPRAIDGITWSGGVNLAPNADSNLQLSYGHQQGSTSFSFDGSYALTTRVRFLGRYSQGVGTNLQNLQNALAGTTPGAGGVGFINPANGAPVQLGNQLGQQAGVYRTTTASASAVYYTERDTVSLEWVDTQQQQLSSAGGAGFGSNSGYTATASWQHVLSEALSASTSLQYGTRVLPGVQTSASTTTTVSLNLAYAVSQTISTNLALSHGNTHGANYGFGPVHDLVVLGLRKTF